MRTRKIFIQEESIYEGVSHRAELQEYRSKKVDSSNESYDWYPEKQSSIKKETASFEEISGAPLAEEYKLHSRIDNYSLSDHSDSFVFAALQEDITNLAVKQDFT